MTTKPRKTDRPAGATYRVDWDPAYDAQGFAILGRTPGTPSVTYHDNLPLARQQALRKSKKHGSAYVIETVDGKDTAQLVYHRGDVEGGTHNWQTH